MKRIMIIGILSICGAASAQTQWGVSNIKMQDGIVYGDVDFERTKIKIGTDCRGEYFRVFEEKASQGDTSSTKLRIVPYLRRHAELTATAGMLCSHKASQETPTLAYPPYLGNGYTMTPYTAGGGDNFWFYLWLATRGHSANSAQHFDGGRYSRRTRSSVSSHDSRSYRSRSYGRSVGRSGGGGFRRRR